MPELLTIEETLDRLHCARATLYRLIHAGEIETVRFGRRRLVSADSLAAFIRGRITRGLA